MVKGVAGEEAAKHLSQGANGDLWQQFLENKLDQKNLEPRKVKSHLPFVAIGQGHITLQDDVLNNVADAAAATAADEAQLPLQVQVWHNRWQVRAYLVALRIATVEAWHWQQAPRKIPKPRLQPIIVPDSLAVRNAMGEAHARAAHRFVKRGNKS